MSEWNGMNKWKWTLLLLFVVGSGLVSWSPGLLVSGLWWGLVSGLSGLFCPSLSPKKPFCPQKLIH